MSGQDFLQLPRDAQWEYGALAWNRTAGFFGTAGAKEELFWSSTLEDEGQIVFRASAPDLLYKIGRAGWEMTSSMNISNLRGGTTHELNLIMYFKQRPATNEEHALAQLISPSALLKRAARYLTEHDPATAIRVLNRALWLEPEQPDLCYLARGRAYPAPGDGHLASDDFVSAAKANHRCGEAYFECGNIRFQHGDYEEAARYYGLALEYIQDDQPSGPRGSMITQARRNRGISNRELGKSKDAIRDFKIYLKRAQLDPDGRQEVEGWIVELQRKR